MTILNQDYLGSRRMIMPGLQTVTVTNPNGTSVSTEAAYSPGGMSEGQVQQNSKSSINRGQWTIWKADLGSFVPKRNGRIIDAAGVSHYINSVKTSLLDSRYDLETTQEASTSGIAVSSVI